MSALIADGKHNESVEYDDGGRLAYAPFLSQLLGTDRFLDWKMSPADEVGFIYLLERLRPKVAIEIGSRFGGSLQILSLFSEKVYSLDIDPDVPKRLAGKFSNVEYLTGSSPDMLPALLKSLQEKGEEVGFILVDGDHTADGVRKDIECILKYTPIVPLCIVMHDSFNAECRRGLEEANWESNPYVQYVELDFTSGQVSSQPDFLNQRWGGLALGLMLPTKRSGLLRITGRANKTIGDLDKAVGLKMKILNKLRGFKRAIFPRR